MCKLSCKLKLGAERCAPHRRERSLRLIARRGVPSRQAPRRCRTDFSVGARASRRHGSTYRKTTCVCGLTPIARQVALGDDQVCPPNRVKPTPYGNRRQHGAHGVNPFGGDTLSPSGRRDETKRTGEPIRRSLRGTPRGHREHGPRVGAFGIYKRCPVRSMNSVQTGIF